MNIHINQIVLYVVKKINGGEYHWILNNIDIPMKMICA